MGEGGERATSTGNIATGNLEEMGCRETPGQQGCAEEGDREACIQSTGQHKEKKTETQRERNVPWWGRKHCCMRARESKTENEDAGSITGNITEKKKRKKKKQKVFMIFKTASRKCKRGNKKG